MLDRNTARLSLVGIFLLFLLLPDPAQAASPVIDHVSPTRGPVGARVAILGSDLDGATEVLFGTTAAAFVVYSDARIVTYVPDGASSGPVTVTAPDGSSASAEPFVVQPNIVLILTDDQRFEQAARMPILQSTIATNGTSFDRGYVVDPLCCPSRASILTGRYSHGTDIYTNMPPHGGFQTFTEEGEDQSTIATWLRSVGYRTALIGKYLNGYDQSVANYVPPGWKVWKAFAGGSPGSDAGLYYDYSMSINGKLEYRGSTAQDYSTTVLTNYATRFISSTPRSAPLFLYLAPTAPHIPAKAESRYSDACGDLPPNRPPSYNEADVSDKPAYIQSVPQWTSQQIQAQDGFYRRQCRTLLSVDDGIGQIEAALQQAGRLSSTFFLFMTDNGNLNGEHRWSKKVVPYEEAIHVPFIIRYDPLTNGRTVEDAQHLVLNIDLAPTFAQLASTQAPGADGVSLLPLLEETATTWRSDFLVEHWNARTTVPTYCGVRNDRYLYVQYATGEEELYDLSSDPYELENLAASTDPEVQEVRSQMHTRLVELCSPPPPDFTP
jgi:N-acetylglucosamine-6-sulfatase